MCKPETQTEIQLLHTYLIKAVSLSLTRKDCHECRWEHRDLYGAINNCTIEGNGDRCDSDKASIVDSGEQMLEKYETGLTCHLKYQKSP
eukprot:scaffold558670_cov20-Prasinocladus_malaysianus.AAC.1